MTISNFTEYQRDAIAKILENIAKNGLPSSRDLDVALDAIDAALQFESGETEE